MFDILRKSLTDAGATEINEYEDGFGIEFDNFADIATFFRRIGSDATYNEHNPYSSRVEPSEDTAYQLTAECELKVNPDSLEVRWQNWKVTS